MGDDGQDGSDGQDGADGEDGSQIFSGDGAPSLALGKAGDFYLDKTNYDLYGPKAAPSQGGSFNLWGTPINIKGAKGNANVTRYIFPGHDFSAASTTSVNIVGVNNPEENAWLVYVKSGLGTTYSLPGYGTAADTYYRTYLIGLNMYISIVNGPGEDYDKIEVIRIETSNTEDLTGVGGSIIPDHLNTSKYEAVAEYYGF